MLPTESSKLVTFVVVLDERRLHEGWCCPFCQTTLNYKFQFPKKEMPQKLITSNFLLNRSELNCTCMSWVLNNSSCSVGHKLINHSSKINTSSDVVRKPKPITLKLLLTAAYLDCLHTDFEKHVFQLFNIGIKIWVQRGYWLCFTPNIGQRLSITKQSLTCLLFLKSIISFCVCVCVCVWEWVKD